jgi:hypothetical protein
MGAQVVKEKLLGETGVRAEMSGGKMLQPFSRRAAPVKIQ